MNDFNKALAIIEQCIDKDNKLDLNKLKDIESNKLTDHSDNHSELDKYLSSKHIWQYITTFTGLCVTTPPLQIESKHLRSTFQLQHLSKSKLNKTYLRSDHAVRSMAQRTLEETVKPGKAFIEKLQEMDTSLHDFLYLIQENLNTLDIEAKTTLQKLSCISYDSGSYFHFDTRDPINVELRKDGLNHQSDKILHPKVKTILEATAHLCYEKTKELGCSTQYAQQYMSEDPIAILTRCTKLRHITQNISLNIKLNMKLNISNY